MPIKSFRGSLADGEADTIRIATKQGLIGYKVHKFELFPTQPGAQPQESVVKIFRQPVPVSAAGVPTVTATVDFDKEELLVAAYMGINDTAYYGPDIVTIFDNVIFNQDIHITHSEVRGSIAVNYHLELEQVKLAKDEATVATLTDMRGRE